MDKLRLWEESINSLKERVEKQLYLSEWRFAQGVEKGELPETDDSKWKERTMPVQWSTKNGPAYFRILFTLPCEIEGISTENGNVDLVFLFPSGVDLFIDGEKVYGHKYWADKIAHPFRLMENAGRGEKRLIVFKTPQGDGLGFFNAYLKIDRIENILFEMDSILYQIKFAYRLSEGGQGRNLRKFADKALSLLRPEEVEKKDWGKVLSDIRDAEKILEVFRKDAKKFRVHLIGHAHIDMNWLWSYEDTVHTCLRDFETVNKLMDRYSDLTFSQSQAHIYKIVEDRNKSLFKKVQDRVKEGRWDVTAATWVEGDINMADGESIVRQILYAGKYTGEKLGTVTDVFWSPDTFGHPVTTPSLLSSAGMRYYYFMRCGKSMPLFRWKGRDGGELLAFNSIYNNRITPEKILPGLIEYYNRYKINDFLFVYGVGDHGGGPTEADIKRKKYMEEKPVFPSFEFSTTGKYFKKVAKYRNKLPVVTGELNTIFEGCYTTHSDIKRANRESENILFTLEALGAVNGMKGKKMSEQEVEELWHDALFNQFHDILDGSAIHSSYEYSGQLAGGVNNKTKTLIAKGMKNLLSGKKTAEDKITVFNPLGWERTSLINLPSGKGRGTSFIAEKICGYGYKTFLPTKETKTDTGKGIKKTGDDYENDFYRLRIDSKTGLIRELYDKKNKTEVFSPCLSIAEDPTSWWAEKAGNLLSVSWEKPHHMSAWIIGNVYRVDNLIDAESVEIGENYLYTTISIKRRYIDSTLLQKVILYRDFPFIDFENEVDWKQQGNNKDGVPMLRVNFNVNMKNPDVFFEVPFGVVKRETRPKEYPALRWAGFNSGRYWTALFNRNKYGYHIDGNNLSLTLLRNAYEPDSVTDSGLHNISYRLFFGKSDVLQVTKNAMEYNMPVVVEYGKAPEQNFSSFVLKGNILPTSFKKTLGRDSYILRLVEICGKKQTAEIEFAKIPKKLYIDDAVERRQKTLTAVKDGKLKLNVAPYQIVTLELVF
jgi:alpha-mannosidase